MVISSLTGGKRSGEVLTLIDLIQKRVFETTGYALETEVKLSESK